MRATSLAILAAGVIAMPAPEPTNPALLAAREPLPDPWCTRVGEPCWKAKRAPVPEPTNPPALIAREADPDPWCTRVGEPCWKMGKRAPEPEPEPVAEPEPWCMRVGEPCWKVKRVAEAFSEAIHSSGGLEARSPEADRSHQPGGAAFKAKRFVNELAGLIALTERDPVAWYGHLGFEHQFHPDTYAAAAPEEGGDDKAKRDAEPEPWCMRVGEPCWKAKREAEAVDKRWCMRVGEPCWKAKRAAEAVTNIIETRGMEDISTKPFDPAFFAKRSPEPWCMRVGEPCWKKRAAEPEPWCMRVGEPCWKAKRDLSAINVVARSLISSLEE